MKDDREYVVPLNDIKKVCNMDYKEKKIVILTQRRECNEEGIKALKEELKLKGYEAVVLPYGIEKVYEDYYEEMKQLSYKEYYECDPNKNTQCKKRTCHVDGGCCWTKHKEYAKDNTEPFKWSKVIDI